MIRADLHVHTVLSPCGDIEMTPSFIIARAKERGISVVGIADHNSTLQCAEIKRIGEREGVFVLTGAEITTKEEVHVLAFVDGDENLSKLQGFLEENLPKIENNVDFFGYQLIVNEEEEVLGEVEYLLISAIDKSINEIEEFVHSLGGIFIPAHIDKKQNSIMSQLGFVPFDLNYDALELSGKTTAEDFLANNPYLNKTRFIHSSDAHCPDDFGFIYSKLDVEGEISFQAIKESLKYKRDE